MNVFLEFVNPDLIARPMSRPISKETPVATGYTHELPGYRSKKPPGYDVPVSPAYCCGC